MEATNITENKNNMITNKQQIMAAAVGLQPMNPEALMYQCDFPGCPLGAIPIFLLFLYRHIPDPLTWSSALFDARFLSPFN